MTINVMARPKELIKIVKRKGKTMSKYVEFPNAVTKVLEDSLRFKEYARAKKSMTSKEFVDSLLRDCVSFMETETGLKLSFSKVEVTWDQKEWERACEKKPAIRETFGTFDVVDNTLLLILRPEAFERWIESWFPQIYFFRFIIHELFHVIFPPKSEKEAHKFSDLVAMEKFWSIEFTEEDKNEIEQRIDKSQEK